ncbi:MAG: DUF1501 domain-containing protein [Caulobacteraceae bacterium]|nr:DUF1501 domain-containing protein [Caulobacteraceae bacterium]
MTSSLSRRRVLQAAALAGPLTIAGRLYAAPQTRTRLLLVFLRGAYDASNVVVPVSSDFYYQSRPSLAVPRPKPDDPNAALPLDRDYALHPALKESIYPLWAKRQVVFVPFAGTDDLSRSHFETQDSIEMGQPLTGRRDFGSGFMNRLAGSLAGSTPIAFTDQLPLSFRGPMVIPNMAVNSVAKPGVDRRQSALIQAMYKGDPLAPQVAEGFTVRDEVYDSLSGEMAAASRGAVSPKGFELSARRVARLMNARFNLGFIDVGGWDTHVNQGGAQGYLAARLAELGRGLAALADESGPAWDDTVVVVISEFGRTFRENGDKGTDHGHGTVYWVMGGKVRGGRLAGEQVAVTQATLFQNRDYPVLNEYRAVLGGLFARIYGLQPATLDRVFPGAKPKDLALV